MRMRRKCSTRSDLCLTSSSKPLIDLIPLLITAGECSSDIPALPLCRRDRYLSAAVWCPVLALVRKRKRPARSQGLSDFGECVRSHHERPSVKTSLRWPIVKVFLFVTILRLPSERHRRPVLTTLGPGYGRLEQQRGYYGSG